MKDSDKDYSLEDFAEEIISRFPLGREASYLIQNMDMLDYTTMLNNLIMIESGKASDRRYTDEASRKDASEFIKRLEAWRAWVESLGPDPFDFG